MLTTEQQAKLDEIKHNPVVHWNNQPTIGHYGADWEAWDTLQMEMQRAILRTLFDVRDLLVIMVEVAATQPTSTLNQIMDGRRRTVLD